MPASQKKKKTILKYDMKTILTYLVIANLLQVTNINYSK